MSASVPSSALRGRERLRGRVRLAVAATFLFASSLHFVATDTEMRLMPDWLPAHRELVYLSGMCEIVGAVGLLVPCTRRAAGWGLALLLVAVWPANVNQFVNNIQLGGVFNSRVFQALRLPLQAPLIWLVLWCVGVTGRSTRVQASDVERCS